MTAPHAVSATLLKEWLRRMLVVRRFEERLIEFFEMGELVGHYHVCIGQEGTAFGVLHHAGADDVVYSTHRSHGHMLVRGADPEALFAEILGRETGCCGGRSGTLHLSLPDLGVPWTSALVGGNVPQAVGAAFALKRLRPGAAAVCFFGDGTFEEGALYEALNLAAVLRVPVLLICENNGLATDVGLAGAFPTGQSGASELSDLAAAFQIPTVRATGIDAYEVAKLVGPVMDEVKAGGGPRFIELGSVRWPGSRLAWPHLAGGPFDAAWLTGDVEPPAEVADWEKAGDPLRPLYRRLVDLGELTPDTFRELDGQVSAEVKGAADRAFAAPMPAGEKAFDWVIA